MKKEATGRKKFFLRNFIFGTEDSLVSTVGLLSGIAVAGTPRKDILIAGVVLIFVEAISMGAGSFLSERSSEAYTKTKKSNIIYFTKGGIIMFFSYFIAGFIPLAPYILTEVKSAFFLSIGFSMLGLFLLGFINSKIFKVRTLRPAIEMLTIGSFAILIGVLAGKLIEKILN